MRFYAILPALVVLLGSAAGLLARSGAGDAPQRPYRLAARAYDRLQIGVTPVSQLSDLGVDLAQGSRLSYLAMVEEFMPANSTGFDAIDPAVQDCLETRDRCAGYSFAVAGQAGTRAVLVIRADHVAYKRLDGEIRTSSIAPPSFVRAIAPSR